MGINQCIAGRILAPPTFPHILTPPHTFPHIAPCRSLDGLLRLLHAMLAAESAYITAMEAASQQLMQVPPRMSRGGCSRSSSMGGASAAATAGGRAGIGGGAEARVAGLLRADSLDIILQSQRRATGGSSNGGVGSSSLLHGNGFASGGFGSGAAGGPSLLSTSSGSVGSVGDGFGGFGGGAVAATAPGLEPRAPGDRGGASGGGGGDGGGVGSVSGGGGGGSSASSPRVSHELLLDPIQALIASLSHLPGTISQVGSGVCLGLGGSPRLHSCAAGRWHSASHCTRGVGGTTLRTLPPCSPTARRKVHSRPSSPTAGDCLRHAPKPAARPPRRGQPCSCKWTCAGAGWWHHACIMLR